MIRIKKIISIIAVLSMLSLNVFAENESQCTPTFKATIDNGNVSVIQDDLTSEIDNSDLNVNVIKQKGNQQNLIYSGDLGGYADGAFADIDFSEINFMVIFDWDGPEDEAIYIIPANQKKTVGELTVTKEVALYSENSANESTSNMILENLDGSLDADMRLIYNNEYYEAVLLSNNTLNVSMTISNSGEAREIVCYLAEYDSLGKLLNLTSNSTMYVPANESITANLAKTFSDLNVASAKIFLWEENNLKPITSSIILQPQESDYYADTYTSAQNYDISKTINGKINTVSDIDYIKFVPHVSGTYIIQTTGIKTAGALYDNSHMLLNDGTLENDNFYIKCNLVANETYYIKVNGIENSIGNYSLIVETYNPLQVNIYSDTLSINGDLSSTIDNSNSVTIKFLNSRGAVLHTQTVNIDNTGKLNAAIPFAVENGKYKAIVSTSEKIVTVIDLNVLKDSVTYNVKNGEFCSVPYVITNTTVLDNLYFSLAFNSNDFEIYDVCDYTQLAENGTGLISGGYVNILETTDSSCIFKSTRTMSNWSGTVNSIKLKSKQSVPKETIRFVYQVK